MNGFLYHVVLCSTAIVLGVFCSASAEVTTQPAELPLKKTKPELFLRDVPPTRFTVVHWQDIPKEISQEIENRILLSIPKEKRPNFAQAAISVYCANGKQESDLVEIRWGEEEDAMRLVLNRHLMAVQLPRTRFTNGKDEDVEINRGKIERAFSEMLSNQDRSPDEQSQKFQLHWLEEKTPVMRASSAPTFDTGLIQDWSDRVDVVVDNTMVTLFTYWKPAQHVGFFFDVSQWFTDPFRAFVAAKRGDN